MDFRQLSYLVTVADEGGVRAAARRLNVTQPPISQALRALEQELGVQLMLRSPKGMEFTRAGEELLAHAREILHGVGQARAAVRRVAEEHTGTIRIGLVSGVVSAGELLAPILTAYRDARPDLEVRLDEISFADQVTPLLREAVDVMIVRGPITSGPLAHRELRVTTIAEEPRVLLVGTSHELAEEDRVHVEDVVDFPTLPLASPDAWSSFWQLDDLRGGSNTSDDIAPVETVPEVQLAVATQRVVVTTPGAVARLQPHPLVRTVALDGAPRAVIAVAARRRDTRRAVTQFIATAQEAAAEHIALLPAGVVPD